MKNKVVYIHLIFVCLLYCRRNYTQTEDSTIKMLAADKCPLSCATCESLVNENIHYEGHIIRYLKSQCDIDNLPMGTVLLGNLEKVGWVVLKCDYAITANSREQNHFYYLNNKMFKKIILLELYS